MGYIDPTEIGSIISSYFLLGLKFDITSSMIQLLNPKGMFAGLPIDNAKIHLTNIIGSCTSYTIFGVSLEEFRLRLFPFSLISKDTLWLGEIPRGSTTSWSKSQT